MGSVFEPTVILQFRRVSSVFEPIDHIAKCGLVVRPTETRTLVQAFLTGHMGRLSGVIDAVHPLASQVCRSGSSVEPDKANVSNGRTRHRKVFNVRLKCAT